MLETDQNLTAHLPDARSASCSAAGALDRRSRWAPAVHNIGGRVRPAQRDAERGFTVLELAIVMAVLAALIWALAFSLSGRATSGRGTAQATDIKEIQKAVLEFAGRHPAGRYPTLNGCLSGTVLDLLTLQCAPAGQVVDASRVDVDNLAFEVSEALLGMDLTDDGDTEDIVEVAPLIWAKAFRDPEGTVQRLVGGFLFRAPRHAYDFLSGGTWEGGRNGDPDRLGNVSPEPDGTSGTITAPEGVGSGENAIDPALGKLPVWVLDGQGIVRVLLRPEDY